MEGMECTKYGVSQSFKLLVTYIFLDVHIEFDFLKASVTSLLFLLHDSPKLFLIHEL
jgi:hypothetical protein